MYINVGVFAKSLFSRIRVKNSVYLFFCYKSTVTSCVAGEHEQKSNKRFKLAFSRMPVLITNERVITIIFVKGFTIIFHKKIFISH